MPHEIADVARFTGSFVAQSSAWTQQSHQAIARRAFRHVPFAKPVEVVHDTIAGAVYGSVKLGSRAVGSLVGGILERTTPAGRQVTENERGAMATGFMNGIFGDRLVEEGNDLAFPMVLRHRGTELDLGLSLDDLHRPLDLPAATGHLVLFAHGLAATEHSWWAWGRRDADGARPRPYAELFEEHLEATPIHLRYNTGLRIAENAAEYAELIARLIARWPVPVERVSLVGHSMGGLLSRATVLLAEERGDTWTDLDCRLVAISSPHLGSPLAQSVHHAANLLDRLEETRFIADVLDNRSVGVKDLTTGAVAEGDLPDHVRTFALSASVTRNADHPIGWALGDTLVRRASALGHRPDAPLRFEATDHVGRVAHLSVANHREVADHLLRWLA